MSRRSLQVPPVAIPTSNDELAEFVTRLGTFLKQIDGLASKADEESAPHLQVITEAKEKLSAIATNLQVEIADPTHRAEELLAGIYAYCTPNWTHLVKRRDAKSFWTSAGHIWRRSGKPTLAIKNPEALTNQLVESRRFRFVRRSYELNRTAMIQNPKLASQLDGVEFKPATETFGVIPAGSGRDFHDTVDHLRKILGLTDHPTKAA